MDKKTILVQATVAWGTIADFSALPDDTRR